MTEAPSTRSPFTAREALLVALALVAVHGAMFLARMPLPHNDLGTFVEPAILLAQEGTLAGPGIQYIDLLYTQGFYSYTPVYFLVLSVWIKIFGAGATPLLGYTLTAHALLLWLIWALIRTRFQGTRLAALLAIISFFPTFNHGRAELTALLFGALAWITLPNRGSGLRLILAGLLIGMTVSASMPALGVSSAVAVGSYQLFRPDMSLRQRVTSSFILTGVAAITLALVVAIVIQWQGAWGFAGAMWKSHLAIRGVALNTMPSLTKAYAIFFSVIPLGILTLAPLAVAVAATWWQKNEGRWVLVAAASYVAGFIVWFLFNKSYLLLHAHYAYLARPIFQGALISSGRIWLRRLGIITACLFSVIYFYFVKAPLLIPMLEDVDGRYNEIARLAPPAGVIFATDGIYFPVLYRPRETISYEMFKDMNTWHLYQAVTPPAIRETFQTLYQRGPQEPEVIIISRWTLRQFGPPDPERYKHAHGNQEIQDYEIFGREVQLPREALSPVIFLKKH